MKKLFFSLFFAILATIGLYAQQISVVSPGGATSIYRTLADAINGADPNSTIYLPGGGFPISDDVEITKKLTIIGIGHKLNNDNPDTNSTISGNLFFNQGSDGSALLGCYVTGKVCIGNDGNKVDDVLIRYNFINGGVEVKNVNCLGTNIDQNYLAYGVDFHGASGYFTHNVCKNIWGLDNGFIEYNIFTIENVFGPYLNDRSCHNSSIYYNIIIPNSGYYGENSLAYKNMCQINWLNEPIVIEANWDDVFVNFNGGAVSPFSDFHFKEAYKQYENQVGIYAGTGFNDNQLAPVPYIVTKRVDEQTDASGKLNVRIRVKAGQ